jgi:hypothetical protein
MIGFAFYTLNSSQPAFLTRTTRWWRDALPAGPGNRNKLFFSSLSGGVLTYLKASPIPEKDHIQRRRVLVYGTAARAEVMMISNSFSAQGRFDGAANVARGGRG